MNFKISKEISSFSPSLKIIPLTDQNFPLVTEEVLYQQPADGNYACFCLNNNISEKVRFYIQTNDKGIFILDNTPFKGITFLAPNCTYELFANEGVAYSNAGTSEVFSPTLRWMLFAGDALFSLPPPKVSHRLASLALCLYQSLIGLPSLFDSAVINETAKRYFSLAFPLIDTSEIYNSLPKLEDPSVVYPFVDSVITAMYYDPAIYENPNFVIPFPPSKYIWKGTNPVLPHWGDQPQYFSTYTTYPPNFGNMDLDAALLIAMTNLRTPAQEQIGKYFADNPPVNMTKVLISLLSLQELSEIEYAQTLALTSMSLLDAGVYAWKVKYMFWGARPTQFIPNYKAIIPVPNFPAFLSGHSSFSSTLAEMLKYINKRLADPINYLAETSGYSRLVSGIHFNSDNVEGLKAGKAIADSIYSNYSTQIINRQNFV